jgi:hypothetical protein
MFRWPLSYSANIIDVGDDRVNIFKHVIIAQNYSAALKYPFE